MLAALPRALWPDPIPKTKNRSPKRRAVCFCNELDNQMCFHHIYAAVIFLVSQIQDVIGGVDVRQFFFVVVIHAERR